MAQDWSVHALVYFCSAVDDLLGAVFYWHLDMELADMKYRKKPVVVEATQWFKMGDHPAVFYNHNSVPTIKTLEGEHFVTVGDFIITGVKGEQYSCKPDIFALTYEEVI